MRFKGILAVLLIGLCFESISEASTLFSPQRTGSTETTSALLGGKGNAPGQFGKEIYIDVDDVGRMYVSDVHNRRIQIFDPDGSLLRMIVPSEGGAFRFERLGDVAVGRAGDLFVVDRQAVAAADRNMHRFYVYTPVIQRFDPEGTYLGFVVVDSMDIQKRLEVPLSPAVDEGGEAVFVAKSDDCDRPLHLTVDPSGDLYVLDETRNRIYRYEGGSGRRLDVGLPGQMDGGSDIAVDEDGRIYVADQGNHRVVQFDRDGQMIRVIGHEGQQNGEFVAPYLLGIVRGRLLVKDASRFERTVESDLRRRKLDPSPRIQKDKGEKKGVSPEEIGRKRYAQRLERVQVFQNDGRFLKKVVLRFDEGSADEDRLRLIGIDRTGGLYFFHEDTHRIQVMSAGPMGFRWSDVHKTYSLRIETQLDSTKLYAGRDPDVDANYIAEEDFRRILQSLRLTYDWTERLRVSWEGRALLLGGYWAQFFPGEELPMDLPDDPSRFRNDYFLIDDVIRGTMRIGTTMVLDPDPYAYREMNWAIEVGGITYDFRYESFSPDNLAHADEDLWGWNASLEMEWDVRRDVNVSLRVAYDSPGDFLNYRYWYWDEDGDLTSTRSVWGRKWTVMIGMNAMF